MNKSVYFILSSENFISLEEFLSANPPCRSCLVKPMCIIKRRKRVMLGSSYPIILFKNICEEAINFLEKHKINFKIV
ncbi:MAG: hypothetical protein PVG65_05200, partial [Candidatus Thorarchaeota archaeon]